MKKNSCFIALIALAFTVLIGSFTTPIFAQAVLLSYNSLITGRCLNSNDKGSVYEWGCPDGNNQTWSVTHTNSDAVTLSNQATGQCLDSNRKGNVYTLKCNDSDNQKWARLSSSATSVNFKNVATDRCLDNDTHGNVYALKCNGGDYQKWEAVKIQGK
ncbi:MAG: ricin-type beta-trefoil lectin domain protein [Rhizonema sp. NSF051]|nr:ricin-type beta-trefoil lectin domain protein [Rhizonema sp. NSF051]